MRQIKDGFAQIKDLKIIIHEAAIIYRLNILD